MKTCDTSYSVQIDQHRLDQAYKQSQMITKEYAKSFYFASQFLPAKKRRATYALYGFCRFTDNLVDDNVHLPNKEVVQMLNEWEHKFRSAVTAGYTDDPIILPFLDIVENFNVNPQYAFELIEGMRMDLTQTRYETYDDLKLFCYRVASTVGLMMTSILGYTDPETPTYAKKLGEAMQLTNILRDIQEDWEMGRVYLSQESLERFGYSEADLDNKVINEHFIGLIEYYMRKSEKLYEEARKGILLLDKDSRFAIESASNIYSGIIPKIRDNKYDVFRKRASVPFHEKITSVIISYTKSKFV